MRRWTRYGWWIAGAGLVGLLLFVALRPTPTQVDTAQVTRGPMLVTIDEEGETRIRQRYVVSAPVSGRVERIDLEPGDPVTAGKTVVARVRAEAPPLLDSRARAELDAARVAATAALGQARAEAQRARAALDLAEKELARERDLDRSGLTTRQAVETREAAVRTATEAHRAATFAVETAQAELQRIDARLRPDRIEPGGRVHAVYAPVSGVILRRVQESETTVLAGAPLVEIGDPENLEVVADLLSTDAVQVTQGAPVRLERWGGPDVLHGRVRRVEPSGFTKISALGVEEQRVNVVIAFEDPASAAQRLGDGFRTEVRIVTWEGTDVLQIPIGALFRRGDQWTVYVVDGDVVRAQPVTVGHRNDEVAEITDGLAVDATVVLHPPDTLSEGAQIERRQG
ncbi:MAG: hypothetical protein AMXMBFR57_27320 [Acidimicrobiia bacterium]